MYLSECYANCSEPQQNLTLTNPNLFPIRTIMHWSAVPGTNGYVSLLVELFAWMGTVSAYEALWEILYPSVNPFGWGHDFWYPQYGLANVPNHKTGGGGSPKPISFPYLSLQSPYYLYPYYFPCYNLLIISPTNVSTFLDTQGSCR